MPKCLKCESELQEDIRRIKVHHPFGTSENTLKQKTKTTRVYHCPNCDRDFAITLRLAEVQVII